MASEKYCRFGKKCKRMDCVYMHPWGKRKLERPSYKSILPKEASLEERKEETENEKIEKAPKKLLFKGFNSFEGSLKKDFEDFCKNELCIFRVRKRAMYDVGNEEGEEIGENEIEEETQDVEEATGEETQEVNDETQTEEIPLTKFDEY